MFFKVFVLFEILLDVIFLYYLDFFNVLWEACGIFFNIGREIFFLKGGKGFVVIYGI